MSKYCMVIIFASLALSACEGEKSASAESESKDEKSGFRAKVNAAKEVAKAGKKVVGVGTEGIAEGLSEKVNWEVNVDGVELPKQSGAMVIGQKIGPATTYSFAGENAMNSIVIKDVEKHQAGEFDPYSVSIMWPEEQWMCTYSAARKESKLEVKIVKKGDGIRAEFEGDLLCRNVKDKSNETKTARVKGWFED